MSKYDGFKDREAVAAEFEVNPEGSRYRTLYHDEPYPIPDDFPTEEEILFAAYDQADYEGAALVIFEKDGKLYEVNGGHCSCYGLEGQWTPEETSWEAIAMRYRPKLEKERGYGAYPYNDYLKELLNSKVPVDDGSEETND